MIREHIPEGYTMIFEAPQRRGKTLAGVLWMLDAFQTGKTAFSSIQLGFPHEKLEFGDVRLADGASKFWNGHIYIDELNFYFDARRSQVKSSLQFSAFLLQQKKQGCCLTGSTHDLISLDLRIREHFDYLVTPTVYPPYPAVPQVLEMEITNGPLTGRFYKRVVIQDVKPYLGLYDSFAVYDPFKHLQTAKEARAEGEPPRRGRRVDLSDI